MICTTFMLSLALMPFPRWRSINNKRPWIKYWWKIFLVLHVILLAESVCINNILLLLCFIPTTYVCIKLIFHHICFIWSIQARQHVLIWISIILFLLLPVFKTFSDMTKHFLPKQNPTSLKQKSQNGKRQ